MVIKFPESEDLRPLGTLILYDNILQKLTHEGWSLGIRPKIQGTWNLHSLLPKGMDFFICMSSTSGIVGSTVTANCAAGNTYLDALAEYHVLNGEKAKSIDLRWMVSEGVVAESSYLTNGLEAAGFLMPLSRVDLLALLDTIAALICLWELLKNAVL